MNHTKFQKGKSALNLHYFINQLFYILYVLGLYCSHKIFRPEIKHNKHGIKH